MAEYNIGLTPWQGTQPTNKGGAGTIETVDNIANIVWQTRAAPPTQYENALGDALESIFADEVYELADIVARLNEMGLHGPDGRNWTEETFKSEVKRLGG